MTPSFEAKVCAGLQAKGHPDPALLEALDRLPRPLVFTNGVFDLLHRGHVTYLAQARAEGASLVVAVNSDESVRRLGKGDDRPINRLEDRLAVLAALESVSLVTGFQEDTPLALILAVRPDVLVKGGDWSIDQIVGAQEVRAYGGRVLSIAFEHQRSTTETLKKIRQAG
jgi:rfaE bifunctional protein nucleotidyltransferase chain/domain